MATTHGRGLVHTYDSSPYKTEHERQSALAPPARCMTARHVEDAPSPQAMNAHQTASNRIYSDAGRVDVLVGGCTQCVNITNSNYY